MAKAVTMTDKCREFLATEVTIHDQGTPRTTNVGNALKCCWDHGRGDT